MQLLLWIYWELNQRIPLLIKADLIIMREVERQKKNHAVATFLDIQQGEGYYEIMNSERAILPILLR
jgi:hypothetical protein